MRYNDGMVFTNDNCIACNRCIAGCPVTGANVAVIRDGKNRIDVAASKCIHCGKCLSLCSHKAREYRDDTEEFFNDLEQGEDISLIVAPSFYSIYADRASHILGYLRSLGVKKIYNAGYGAEISLWAHVNYLKQPGENHAFISQTCPMIINYAERCLPELLKYIVPVQSPAVCTAIYARKYLGDTSKFAFLNPCIAKKDEIESSKTNRNISYSFTYAHLMKHLQGITMTQYESENDLELSGMGGLLLSAGGFQECVASFFQKEEITLHYDGLDKMLVRRLEGIAKGEKKTLPLFAEVVGCANGCISGSGINIADHNYDREIAQYRKAREMSFGNGRENWSSEQFFEKINEKFADLSLEDFSREFEEKYKQPHWIPESTYDEVFKVMHKDTKEKQNINCHSCGYSSCRKMVEAIAYGYGKMENCVHYVNDELKRQLYIDAKTKLPNSLAFPRDCERLMEEKPNQQFVICTGDVNRYKLINELYSYSIGDQVLGYLVRFVQEFTEGIGVCAYFGSGKFAMCFEDTEENRNRLMAKEYFECRSIEISSPITMRFGLYFCKKGETTIERAINLASFAMDRVKDRSRNSYACYTEEMGKELSVDAAVTAQMHNAMKNGEFILYLQPQYNHSTKEMVGAEALCRWLKPDGTIVSPMVFVPIFEKNGFIREFDRYIWESAFILVKNLISTGKPMVPISVNISRISLMDDEIVSVIAKLWEKYQIPVEALHFEITESAYIDNQDQLIERVKKIRSMGFDIAMDDFGRGYSSLNTLKDVPIDILKLDMGFLRGDNNMERGGNIISSVIRMAHSLELATVAEGVETMEQADFLRSVGCDVIQGFLYAKPMPVEEYKELVHRVQANPEMPKPRTFGNININNFFSPRSGETVMFEKYSGAAAVFEYDRGTLTTIRINDKLLETLGYGNVSFREFQKKFLANLGLEEREKFFLAIRQAIDTREEAVCITKHRRSDGSNAWMKSHIWSLGFSGEKYILYLLAEDVTLEKGSQEKLTNALEQLQIIVDNSPIGICLFQGTVLRAKQSWYLKIKVVRSNAAGLNILGYSEDEVLTWTETEILDMIHPLDKMEFMMKVHQLIHNSFAKNLTIVCRVRQKDENYIWLRVMVAGVKKPDGTFWLMINYVDYSEEQKKKVEFYGAAEKNEKKQ